MSEFFKYLVRCPAHRSQLPCEKLLNAGNRLRGRDPSTPRCWTKKCCEEVLMRSLYDWLNVRRCGAVFRSSLDINKMRAVVYEAEMDQEVLRRSINAITLSMIG